MTHDTKSQTEKLEHDLKNAEQEKRALKGLLKRAADEIDDLAGSDCETEDREKARRMAGRLRDVSDDG
ncbi:hypothetical protein [Aurantiacibacter spongiae]|uniref:Uncharacterized protein n=1 Tax=Aurantiacibacter spongiae TaxID=2488860 RepID=A0A3N5CT29_9SPHN|nr:hypothetical protein [Aurantiacibacter spongiae]RPF72333.1 hypothetical protein EG799_12390 [Aurantiacibacter spongiae]